MNCINVHYQNTLNMSIKEKINGHTQIKCVFLTFKDSIKFSKNCEICVGSFYM